VILTPIRAPNANAFDERWSEPSGRSAWTGCSDAGISTAEHYNGHRSHRALGLAAPLDDSEDSVAIPSREVHRRNVLGGLIHEYHQMAACRIRVLDPSAHRGLRLRPADGASTAEAIVGPRIDRRHVLRGLLPEYFRTAA
jgi:hypothetical protein